MSTGLTVQIVTSWGDLCGIAEHSAALIAAVETADATIHHAVVADLHPRAVLDLPPQADLLVLNYQAALLSQWHPAHIHQVQQRGTPVLCIFHDTGVPNSDHCKAIIAAADAAVVHEPFDDLPKDKVRYWRMGVPEVREIGIRTHDHHDRPILGTIGHDLGHKCWGALFTAAASVGWGGLILTPEMSPAHEAALHQINPWLVIRRGRDRLNALADLSACDATAFTNVCHSTGQSAALLQGIAARQPVIALSTCRQYRALLADPLGATAIHWVPSFPAVAEALTRLPLGRFDPGIVALATQESWTTLGAKYAHLYRELVA